MSNPVFKNINDLNNYKFVIPEYQRGYRWRQRNIKELIEDLKTFVDDPYDLVYCMQPIYIKTIDEEQKNFEVLDGQQRLTSLWILNQIIKDQGAPILPEWSFEHLGKDSLSYTLNQIKGHADYRILNTTYNNKPDNIFSKDIDSAHIQSAIQQVINNEDNLLDDLKYVFSKLNDVQSNKKVLVIWTPIEGSKDDVVDKFMTINSTKIPLTEAELVKAYFTQNIEEDKQKWFSFEWERIEKKLQNEAFWGFVTSKKNNKKYMNRMDYLLETYSSKEGTINNPHAVSQFYYNQMVVNKASDEWDEVKKMFERMEDWYDDYELYHLIGFLTEIKDSGKIIKTLVNECNNQSKDDFRIFVKGKIKEWMDEKNIYSSSSLWQLSSINYESTNRKTIRDLLLLFNISLLLRAYYVSSDNSAQRFPFDYFIREEIDVEHINPHHFEGKDVDDDDRIDWAEQILLLIDKSIKQNFINDIQANIINKYKAPNATTSDKKKALKELGKRVDEIEENANINDLSNLTLLDQHINKAYQDNFYPIKRNHIIAGIYGTERPDDQSQYYSKSVVFPGTMWVFLRHNKVNSFSAYAEEMWTVDDQKTYAEFIIDAIDKAILKKGFNSEKGAWY